MTMGILGVVEELNEMHDRLRFKRRVYADAVFATVLEECALLLASAADELLQDIVSRLSAKAFPFASRVAPVTPRRDCSPAQHANAALQRFASVSPPPSDAELIQMRFALETISASIQAYCADRSPAIQMLLDNEASTMRYLLTVSTLGAG